MTYPSCATDSMDRGSAVGSADTGSVPRQVDPHRVTVAYLASQQLLRPAGVVIGELTLHRQERSRHRPVHAIRPDHVHRTVPIRRAVDKPEPLPR